MSLPYEILIRGDNGAYKGSHAIDEPGGAARALTAEDLALVAAEFNGALLVSLATAEAERQKHEAAVNTISAAIANPALDAEATVLAAKAAVDTAKQSDVDKLRAELESKLAAIEAELSKLPPK